MVGRTIFGSYVTSGVRTTRYDSRKRLKSFDSNMTLSRMLSLSFILSNLFEAVAIHVLNLRG